LLGFCTVCFITGFIPAVDTLLLKNFIDNIGKTLETDTLNLLWPWILYYPLWWESVNILYRIYNYLYLSSFPFIKANVIDRFYNYIQYHSTDFFKEHMVGYISNRISEASKSLERLLSLSIEKMLMKFSVVVTSLITMHFVHPIISIIFIVWMIIFGLISFLFFHKVIAYSGDYAKTRGHITGRIIYAISNINAIRMFSTYRHEREYLKTHINESIKSNQKMEWLLLKMRYFQSTSCAFLMAAVTYSLLSIRTSGSITMGELVLVMTLCIVIVENIWELTEEIGDFLEELGSFNQAISMIKPYVITDKPNASILRIYNGTIEFENVNFKYEAATDQELFTNKNLIIKGGGKVGLVGFSGSGKSTFVNLICRMYDTNSGVILVDGQNIKDVTVESLRQAISLIPQEPTLFKRSIMDNIKYGTESATEGMVIEAAKKAYIHDEIIKLPDGYNTLCNEKGANLSGGKSKEIVIARAILKNAPILILDEATSALDNITEKHIKNS
jgi:ATP-binding cassette subfamily B protein